jgi:transglutaminase-like putative cysteine protease
MKKWLLIICLFTGVVYGQKSEVYQTFKDRYPYSSFVRLQEEITYRISLEKDALKIQQEIYEEDLYLDQNANFNSKRTLSYSSFFDLLSIEASSYSFEKNKYQANEVKEFNQKNDLDDTFYDDTKKVSFLYPKLQEGSKTQISYSYDIKNPRFLSAFYFGDYYPIAKNKVTLIVDKNIELEFKEFNTENQNISFEKKKKGRNYIYTWTKNNTNKYEIDRNAPSFKTVIPHIIPMIRSYKTKNEEKVVLDGVASLYDWYYSLVKDINQQEKDEELTTLVASLTAGKTSDLEKVKAIYYWTQQNIKYIAFEYALGGFIPREANDVFKKKYGDCKDNSSILSEMLDIAGLSGQLTWIGTRSIPYTYEEVPTPAVDNHMILSYEDNGTTYYLDATGRYTPIEFPTAFIQGKEALISFGEDNFKVKEVPVMSAEKSQMLDQTTVEIQDETLVGKSTTRISGYLKGDLFYNLEELKKENDILELFNRRFTKGNNKFLIGSFSDENKYSYDEDYIVNYDFMVKNYVQRIGDEIFINPHFNKMASRFKIDKDRKSAIEYDYKKQYQFTNSIQVPEGYAVDYIPSNRTFGNDLIAVELSYKQEGNTIVCQSNLSLNYILLNLEQQKEVNAIIKKVAKAYKEIIILKKQ